MYMHFILYGLVITVVYVLLKILLPVCMKYKVKNGDGLLKSISVNKMADIINIIIEKLHLSLELWKCWK